MHDPDCPDKKLLTAYNNGKLSDADVAVVQEHLEGCSACDATFDRLRPDADTLVGELRQPALEDPFEREPQLQQALGAIRAMRPPASAAAEASPELRLGSIRDYRLLEKVGEGGMGAVYRAVHMKLDKIVAVKVLPVDRVKDEQILPRFEREMKAVGKLDHPNIVRALDAGEHDNTHYLVMEFVDGINLAALSKHCGPLPIPDACELIRQAAVGLQYAYENGLVHRDVKPSNLMLTAPLSPREKGSADEGARPTVKILDLGLALLQGEHPAGEELTTAGQVMGTLDYIAPEQTRDAHHIDIRADIYGLGCTLYKLLTGHAPFVGPQHRSVFEKMLAHAQEAVPPITNDRAEVPDELVKATNRMMAKKPDDRFSTPAEVAATLEQFCTGRNLSALVTAAQEADVVADDRTSRTQPAVASAVHDTVSTDKKQHVTAAQRSAKSFEIHVKPQDAMIRSSRFPRIATGIAAVLILLAGVVFFLQTKNGTVKIEINDPSIEVTVTANGYKIKGNGEEIELTPGEHSLHVKRDDLEFDTKKFVLSKGKNPAVRIEFLDGQVQVVQNNTVIGSKSIAGSAVQQQPNHALKSDGKTNHVVIPSLTATDPHRRAAEAVLRLGGSVGILTPGQTSATKLEDLPRGRFALSQVVLVDKKGLTDKDLELLGDAKSIEIAILAGTRVSDESLRHFSHAASLRGLDLSYAQVTDDGIKHLSNLTGLKWLNVGGNPGITDASYRYIARLKGLRYLTVGGERITYEGLKAISELPNLAYLVAGSPHITGAGLGHLRSLKFLQHLDFRGAAIDDEAVAPLGQLQRLRFLNLLGTRVTESGAARLQELLPNCAILHSSLAANKADRRAAQWVLDNGGTVVAYPMGALQKIPQEPFAVANTDIGETRPKTGSVNLNGLRSINSLIWARLLDADNELANIGKLTSLTYLDLNFADVSAAGLEQLAALSQLENLSLSHCNRMSDEALASVAAFKHLWSLRLGRTPITDDGLSHLAGLDNLYDLKLNGCKNISGAGLEHLSALPALRRLDVTATSIDDDALVHLKKMQGLRVLMLSETKVSATAVAELQQALPDCVIFHESLSEPGTH